MYVIASPSRTAVKERIWELDFFRGIALLLMIYFHLIYDLKEYCGLPVNYEGNFNYFIGKASAVLFIFISGICSFLTKSNIKRGIKVLAASLLVTVASCIFDPAYVIIFGILQLIGVSMIIAGRIKRINHWILLLISCCLLTAGYFTSKYDAPNNIFLIFGVINRGYTSFDYYPLIPWLGVFTMGLAAGKVFYASKKSRFRLRKGLRPISAAGRHTLPIYFIHQPLILLVIKAAALFS